MASSYPGAVSAVQVGSYFVTQYYQILQKQPDVVHQFYSDGSSMIRVDGDATESAAGILQIHSLLVSLGVTSIEIQTINSSDSWDGGILVMVKGFVKTRESSGKRKFVQTFFLAPQDKGYFVLNDMLQFIEDEVVFQHPEPIQSEGRFDMQLSASSPLPEPPVSDYVYEEEPREYVNSVDVEDDPVDKYSLPEQQVQQDFETEVVVEETPAEETYSSFQSVVNNVQDEPAAAVEEPVGEPQKKTYASILRVAKERSAPVAAPQPYNRSAQTSSEWNYTPQPAVEQSNSAQSFVPESGAEATEEGYALEEEGELLKSVYVRNLPHEKELHRAAVRGSVDALLELLSEDPQILNRTVPSLSDTPLHVASLLGHSAFAEELLSRNPELAAELDSRGSSPLHLAAAKGSVEIVKNLVRVNPDLGFVLDRDGFTPLHLGVIKGRAAVVAELAQVRPAATRVLTQEGESGLHLCVKHHRLEVLKVLVESIGRDDEFVHWRDGDGNTVLHVAVAKKQLEVIKYLLTNTKIDVNAENAIGFTALDVLTHSTRDLRDLEIKQSLQKAAAPRTNRARFIAFEPEMDSVRVSNSISMQPLMSKKMSVKEIVKKKGIDWLGRKRSSLMVVSSLIATVAFQAALSPPGGVWQDDYLVYSNGTAVERPHNAGQSVMAITEPVQYGQFMILNTIAFLASLSIILLLVSGLPMRRKRWMWFQMVIMWIAITALSGTYFVGLIFMTPDRNRGSYLYYVTQISVLIWLGLMGLVFIGNLIRVIIWLLRMHGYMEEKETDDSLYVDYDDNDEI